jgi:hypothetical protein
MKANWTQDLARGDVGERDFLRTFPLYRKGDQENMYEHDLVCSVSGSTVELKTDYYDMDKTPNLIVERYSNEQKGTAGGPYRHNSSLGYWVYYYKKNGVFLFYDAGQLVEKVTSLNLPLLSIQNQGYTTGVHRVKRTDVEDCLLHVIVLPTVIG